MRLETIIELGISHQKASQILTYGQIEEDGFLQRLAHLGDSEEEIRTRNAFSHLIRKWGHTSRHTGKM